MSDIILIPENVTRDLQMRQALVQKLSDEINLILNTLISTVDNTKSYKLSDDLTKLVAIKAEPAPPEDDLEAITDIAVDREEKPDSTD